MGGTLTLSLTAPLSPTHIGGAPEHHHMKRTACIPPPRQYPDGFRGRVLWMWMICLHVECWIAILVVHPRRVLVSAH